MTTLLTPDICVIGGGSGGLSVAAAAAAFGVDVVLLEAGKMGGDCLNYGCVPSKALLAAGKTAQSIREAGKFGVTAGEVAVDAGGRLREHRADGRIRPTRLGADVPPVVGCTKNLLEEAGHSLRAVGLPPCLRLGRERAIPLGA